jgi:putative DNA primase/helicase
MLNKIDFNGLGRALLANAGVHLSSWLPGGKINGKEYECGSLHGEAGGSLRINLNTGKWADFATGDKGGDLISLYAAINGLKNSEAAAQLAHHAPQITAPPKPPSLDKPPQFIKPPKGTPLPNFTHKKFGKPVTRYTYRDHAGDVLYFVCRYELDGEKSFGGWSYTDDGRWLNKSWPAPRPLYGLELLNNDKPILIVEGEKSCDAARTICGTVYNVVTWPNGATAYDKADWSPVFGKKVLIWPDADEPGRKAAASIVKILLNQCPEIKVLNVPPQDGWDAADALAEGWTWADFKTWAKEIAKPATAPTPEPDEIPMPTSDDVPMVYESSPEPEPATAATVTNNIVVVANDDMFDPPPHASIQAIAQKCGIAQTKQGHPLVNVDNVLRCFQGCQEFHDLVWYDSFHKLIFTKWNTGERREWSDVDDINLSVLLQRYYGFIKIQKYTVNDAIQSYAYQNPKNEPRDWMDTLTWDGTSRIESFFTDAMGAPSNDYTRAVSKNFWVAMVARIYKPGVKYDNLVVLEGKQGTFKSTALMAIGGEWYGEVNESPSSKDFFQALQGKMLVEISELDAFGKADVTTIKRVLSTPTDRFRPPYGKAQQSFPRTCVFVGSTNDNDYLKDHTGARRFFPIQVTEANVDFIKTNRDQLFAEAVHLFKLGETWWQVPKESAIEEQEARRQVDMWEDVISTYLLGKTETSMADIATGVLKIEPGKLDLRIQHRIGRILRFLGWNNLPKKRAGKTIRLWSKGHIEQTELHLDFSPQPKVRNYAPGAEQPFI